MQLQVTDWGPVYWSLLHHLTLSFPQNPNKRKQVVFMYVLQLLVDSIPCQRCKKSIQAYLNTNTPDLSSRKGFIKWMIDAHNMVNTKLNKKQMSFSAARHSIIPNQQNTFMYLFIISSTILLFVCIFLICR
jgi:hypothetical protein